MGEQAKLVLKQIREDKARGHKPRLLRHPRAFPPEDKPISSATTPKTATARTDTERTGGDTAVDE